MTTSREEAQAAATTLLNQHRANGRDAQLVETADYFTIEVDGIEIVGSYPFEMTADDIAALEAERDALHVKVVEMRTLEDDLWAKSKTADAEAQERMGEVWIQTRADLKTATDRYSAISKTMDLQIFGALTR